VRATGGTGVVASLVLDLERSVVGWRGTKFRGLRQHEGVVRLAAGELALCGGERAPWRACGGRVVVDLRTIAVTSIPAHEPVPRRRLTDHLHAPDFFWTARYPTAAFAVVAAEPVPYSGESRRRYRVTGDLTFRGVTRRIAVPVEVEDGAERATGRADGSAGLTTGTAADAPPDGVRARARFRIDRQQWGVAYRGSRLTNDLVDDDVTLDVRLVARPRTRPATRPRSADPDAPGDRRPAGRGPTSPPRPGPA
jgi:polyisoprenoid-binding protein YceI